MVLFIRVYKDFIHAVQNNLESRGIEYPRAAQRGIKRPRARPDLFTAQLRTM
jgi:hypothetical protein